MVENRPILTFFTHAILIAGVLFLCFPVWMALVASTHGPGALSQSPIPLWFGDQAWENYSQLLAGGLPEAGGVPIGMMMFNSLIMALVITFGKIFICIGSSSRSARVFTMIGIMDGMTSVFGFRTSVALHSPTNCKRNQLHQEEEEK